MSNQKPSFRFEIDNFSEKNANVISSKTFIRERRMRMGNRLADGHLSVFLYVSNSTTVQPGWKKSINFYFVLLDQSGKELHRSPILKQNCSPFCASNPGWGCKKALPLSKFQEEGFLEKDRLIIEVYINGGEVEDVSNKKKTVDINGFQVFASQVTKVGKIFTEHPDIAKDFKSTKHEVKTAYMNVLLRVIKTLNKPPKSLSETRLNKASSELSELMNVGFKLDWLKSKLDEVSLEREKPDVETQVQQLEERFKLLELKLDESHAQKIEERVKHLELKLDELSFARKIWDDDNESRTQQVEKLVKNLELKLDEVSLGRKISDDDNESRAQQVEERVKNLELKHDEVALERKKADDTYESLAKKVERSVKNLAQTELEFKRRLLTIINDLERKKSYAINVFDSRIEQIETHVMSLRLKVESLITKLEEMSSEKKKADDTNGSLIQQLEESVKNIELMVSHVKVELDKKKDKSCADGFLLVD